MLQSRSRNLQGAPAPFKISSNVASFVLFWNYDTKKLQKLQMFGLCVEVPNNIDSIVANFWAL